MVNFSDTPTAAATVVQGGATTIAIAFFRNALNLMTPFLFLAVILIVVDLVFGIAAARKRGEEVRSSRAIRRTINKVFEYICWIILAASAAVAFNAPDLNWIVLSLVMGIEAISVFSNYLFCKGKKIKGLDSFIVKLLGSKFHTDTSDIKVEDTK